MTVLKIFTQLRATIPCQGRRKNNQQARLEEGSRQVDLVRMASTEQAVGQLGNRNQSSTPFVITVPRSLKYTANKTM